MGDRLHPTSLGRERASREISRARAACLTAGVSALLLVSVPRNAPCVDLCVHPGGLGGCFSTIQAAIDAASNKTEIAVAAGSFAENLDVAPGVGRLTLIGAGPGLTTIEPTSGGRLVDISAPRAKVELVALTLDAMGLANEAVYVDEGKLTLSNVVVRGAVGAGVEGRESRVSVIDATIEDNGGHGIGGFDNRVRIEDAIVRHNGRRGVVGSKAVIRDSTIEGNGEGGLFGDRFNVETTTIIANGGPGIDVNRLKLLTSTVSGNQDAGVRAQWGSRIRIESSTITANSSPTPGGGLYFDGKKPAQFIGRDGRMTLRNSIVANNVAPSAADCMVPTLPIKSRGWNIVGDSEDCRLSAHASDRLDLDPHLDALADNGGPTLTHALLPASPAIDTGRGCRRLDQRGERRRKPCDVGAFEVVE